MSKNLSGVNLIAAERKRQIEKEGWTTEHDDAHCGGELAAAAAVYASPTEIYRDADGEELSANDRTQFNYITDRDDSYYSLRLVWPWQKHELKRGNRVRELVKAGALIAAEIDRLLRKPHPQTEGGEK